MLRKLGVMLIVMMMVGGSAWADQIDGMASSGQAAPVGLNNLHVNPGGLGDALIFGYYNVRNGAAFIRLVNTSDNYGVVGKLRFREAKSSEEVLDFLICLSPSDQWTAWLVDPTLVGRAAGPALLLKGDNAAGLIGDDDTVTVPTGWDEVYFSAVGDVTENDTLEGYFEFISSATIPISREIWDNPNDPFNSDQCKNYGWDPAGQIPAGLDVGNVLMGSVHLFDASNILLPTFAYNAVAIANFLQDTLGGVSTTTDKPLWSDNSIVYGVDGVNYVLTKQDFFVLYDLEGYLAGRTDYLINFPTKHEILADPLARCTYFPVCYDDQGNRLVCGDPDCETYCTNVALTVWNDEEEDTSRTDFSPVPPGQANELCYEVNYIVVGDNSESILDTDVLAFSVATAAFDIGWIKTSFADGYTTVDNDTSYGMPAVGYQLDDFLCGLGTHMLPLRYNTNLTGEALQCDIDHLWLCATQATCEGAGGHWCDDDNNGVFECQANACAGDECDADHLDLCTNAGDCQNAGGVYWKDQCLTHDAFCAVNCGTDVECHIRQGIEGCP